MLQGLRKMKNNFLMWLQEKLMSKSKQPWACFESSGISSEGIGFSMRWNDAFIKSLHEQGVQGATEQETMQLFFLFLSSRITDNVAGDDMVNPAAMPTLSNEANEFKS